MGDDFLAGIQGVPDFGHGITVMVDVAQYRRLVGGRDVVDALARRVGLLKGFDGGDGLAGILCVGEELLRYGMFECRA